MVYRRMNISLFLTLYGPYLLNLFIKTSTWLVVILALYRHAAISLSFARKEYLTAVNTFLSILICFVFWILLLMPLTWSWETKTDTCQGKSFIVLDIGKFELDVHMRQALTHVWTAVGFLLPVCILAYCNMTMIISLRTTLQNTSSHTNPQSLQRHRRVATQRRVTITLVAIVASFFIFVFPSEVIQYYFELSSKRSFNQEITFNFTVACNLLQTINMSINFLLYCVVNSNFRATLSEMIPKCNARSGHANGNLNYSSVRSSNMTSVMCTEL